MQSSKISMREWVVGIHPMSATPTGTADMRVCRELGMRQGTARLTMQRIRKGFDEGMEVPFRGPVGKTAVAGVRDCTTERPNASVVARNGAEAVQGFAEDRTEDDAAGYTDMAQACIGIDREHEVVNHSVGEFVRDDVHTQGMDGFRSMFRRGFIGTFHELRPKHLDRYVQEFAGRHNVRDPDTLFQVNLPARGMVGKRLRYRDPITDKGSPSGARS